MPVAKPLPRSPWTAPPIDDLDREVVNAEPRRRVGRPNVWAGVGWLLLLLTLLTGTCVYRRTHSTPIPTEHVLPEGAPPFVR